MKKEIIVINGYERKWKSQRFILGLGAYASTLVMVWADHLEQALDEVIDWIADNEPEMLCNDAVHEAYNEAIADGKSEDEAHDAAQTDVTCGGNCGDYIRSDEWWIVAENPTRDTILRIQGRR